EDHPLAEAARQRGVSYGAAAQARRRAEHRLAAYLCADAHRATTTEGGDRDLETHALDSVIITTAAPHPTLHRPQSLSVAAQGRRPTRKPPVGVLKHGPHPGVQGCAGTPATSAACSSAAGPLAPSCPTPEVPR